MGGAYAEYGPKLRIVFPDWTGGGNWGGTAFDPKLGYVFVNTKSEGIGPLTFVSAGGWDSQRHQARGIATGGGFVFIAATEDN